MLCLFELHGKALLRGVVEGSEGADDSSGITFEDLRNDGMAAGICAGSGAHREAVAKAAIAIDIEPDVDRAESRSGGDARLARLCRGNDHGLQEAARSDRQWTA